MVLYLLDKLVARLIALGEDDSRLDDLSPVGMRQSGNCALEHGRMLHQRALNLERTDAVAGALDNIVVSADEPIVAVAVTPCGVAGVIIAELEALLHRGVVFPVVAEKSGRMTPVDPDADRTDHTVFALLAVFVEKSYIIAGRGLAHGAGLYLDPRIVCEQDGGFTLTEALIYSHARQSLYLMENLGVERLAREAGVLNIAEIVF